VAILYKKRVDSSLVVIKEIDMHVQTAEGRSFAMKEADFLSSLDHPNIVYYYNKYELQGTLLIEMEYCDGGTLEEHLQILSKPPKEHEVLIIFGQIVSAICYIHDKNIIHRDLKTANCFLTHKKSLIKVGDFGIARALSAHTGQASTIVGTPGYMSPEIVSFAPLISFVKL
jgi:NIMA (never in mitosis gene a)-related kinase 9